MNCSQIIHCGSLVCFTLISATLQAQDGIDFNSDIRPILADTCYKCHGPDDNDRKADLRLDTKSGLIDDSGAVVPGELDSSELYQRIVSDDDDLLMPPADSGRVLSNNQKELIKQWIQQGAQWRSHWALEAPTKPEIPQFEDEDNAQWPANAIDHFVLRRLKREGLSPSASAERATLIRRVSFDLTGLPPTTATVERYTALGSEDWYEQLVDELLDSSTFGEHMARYWLDAARFGDTHGLHLDNYREMWAYRDWVIDAYNRNLSFEDFAIEQLAGDLLENPTDDQLVASGFNRAHITTSEGGTIAEELYVRNVVDRVSTTGTVFMGMTVGCAQCHDHKFDPISQREFYQLFAFFNNLTDAALDGNVKNPPPVMKVLSQESKIELAKLEAAAKATADQLSQMLADYNYVEPEEVAVSIDSPKTPTQFDWIDDDAVPVGAKKEGNWQYVSSEGGLVHSGKQARVQIGEGMKQHLFTGAYPLKAKGKDIFYAWVYLDPKNPPTELMLQFNDGDWNHRAYWGANEINWGEDKTASRFYVDELPECGKWTRLEIDAEKVGFANLTPVNGIAFTQWDGKAYWDSAGIVSSTEQGQELQSFQKWLTAAQQSKAIGLPDAVKTLINKPNEEFSEQDRTSAKRYFLTKIHPESAELFATPQKAADDAKAAYDEYNNNLPTTLISKEKTDFKEAFVLERGEYDKKGDKVERQTPAAFPPFGEDLPRNRLGFARWLTDPSQPLTARVTVNRFWQQFFGIGIVKTSEDFGVQGEIPSHPDLLDWLAVDFIENDWDVKRALKQMVMSKTYRQTSKTTQNLTQRDPENRLLARGPRFRLDAEMLRDQALAISDLLVKHVGGPSVKPPQPSGLWYAVGYSDSNTVRFQKDSGPEKVHRRSLYTFWKRTSPPPQMNIFDAPSREACSVRRERTNTPLQALLLMNDPQYVEAARFFAQRTLDAELPSDAARLEFIFQNALARSAKAAERAIILEDLDKHRRAFENEPGEAKELIAIGEKAAEAKYDPVELGSWTMIASLIMNMDEFVTKN